MAFDKETGKEAGKKSKRGKDTKLEEIREVYCDILENNKNNIQKWFDEVAAKDPEKALDLMLKLGSYVIAKPRSLEIKPPFVEQPFFIDFKD
jgi:hypothetical protein